VGSLTKDENKVRELLTLYKETVAHTEGNGLKLPKFHQILHFEMDME
jgi:hypothetical protein